MKSYERVFMGQLISIVKREYNKTMDNNSANMKKNGTRCDICNKRTRIMTFECKCGKKTCTEHRGVNHECNYDYFSEQQKSLKNDLYIKIPKLEI